MMGARTSEDGTAAAAEPAGFAGAFRIGSLTFDLRAARAGDAQIVAEMFKQALAPGPGPLDHPVLEIADAGAARPGVPADGVLVARGAGTLTLFSEVLTASLAVREGGWRARIDVHARPADPLVFRMHLQIALHRILLALGAAYLHAGAVTIGGRTFVFIGEKGAGKSSIAVMLGRAGGTILSDDHVLVRAAAPSYFVSGCETFARVAADTEAAAFDRPLEVAAADYAGTLKKEFAVATRFASLPHVDAPIAGVLFPRVGAGLALRPRAGRAAAIDLIQRTRGSYRPQDAADVQALLDFWSGLVGGAPAWDLELSPDVHDLACLPALLDGCAPPS